MNKLEIRNFCLFAMGRFVSLIGSGIQMIAIPLYILDLTGSGTMMGIFTFLSWMPTLAMGPFAGVLGDRWNRKKIMVNMDYARGGLILLLAFMAISNNMSIYILFICQVLISLMDAIFASSTSAMVPELVNSDDLMKANSIISGITSIAMIVGPVLGGGIYGIGGIELVFLINGISFVLSATSELFIKYISTTQSKEKISMTIVKKDFKEGFMFIRENKNLLTLLIFFCSINFVMNPAFAVILPYGLTKVIKFSDLAYGIIQATFMAGILLGNIIIIIVSFLAKETNRLFIKLGLFGMVLFNMFFAFTLFPDSISYFGGASITLAVVIGIQFLIIGVFNALLNTPIQTNFQKLIPNKLRSRVNSVTMIITQAGVPLGAVVYGIILDLTKVHFLYIGVSVLFTILTIGFLIVAPSEVYDPKNADTIKSLDKEISQNL